MVWALLGYYSMAKAKKLKTTGTKKKEAMKTHEVFLEVKKLSDDASVPEYMLNTDLGLDLKANESLSFLPMEQKAVKTGVVVKIPEEHVGLIRDRAGIVSGMNIHTVAGTFDPAYRGEVSVVLVNFSDDEVEIEKGMRIAQMIILPVTKVKVKIVDSLSDTERGSRGFGSTGMKEKLDNFKKLDKDLNKFKRSH
jgi:dUTP pyrophosphatase